MDLGEGMTLVAPRTPVLARHLTPSAPPRHRRWRSTSSTASSAIAAVGMRALVDGDVESLTAHAVAILHADFGSPPPPDIRLDAGILPEGLRTPLDPLARRLRDPELSASTRSFASVRSSAEEDELAVLEAASASVSRLFLDEHA
jgi:hypothetical protein